MALNLIGAAVRSVRLQHQPISAIGQHQIRGTFENLIRPQPLAIAATRNLTFLCKTTGADLWKSCTTVSNATRKRGLGKNAGKNLTKNLNRGQVIGVGRTALVLPGLNTRLRSNNVDVQVQRGVDDHAWSEKLFNVRDETRNRKRYRLNNHFERGYSGTKLAGRSVGPLEPVGVQDFAGFETRCIESKITTTMCSEGRQRNNICTVIAGNKNGVCGFGQALSYDSRKVIEKAKKNATHNLVHFDLCDDRTVHHDFFTQYNRTKIFVYKMPEGYGLTQTHRIIKTMCQLIGIKDLRTKCVGSKRPMSIIKAFFVGLLQQKTYQQMAEEKKLFLVEFQANKHNFPRIVGIPSVCRTADQIPKEENLDFKQYVMHGRLIKKPTPRVNPFMRMPSYQIHLKRKEKNRCWPTTRKHLLLRYGKLRSFLTDKYPEATALGRDEY